MRRKRYIEPRDERRKKRKIRNYEVHTFEQSHYDEGRCSECGGSRDVTWHKR
jgi:hypothetical protein